MWRRKFNFKIQFTISYLMMTVSVKWSINSRVYNQRHLWLWYNQVLLICKYIRSVHEAEFSFKYIGSFISWCRPWDEESASSCVPSLDVLSSSHQVEDRALKSLRIRLKKGFESLISFIKSLNEDNKFSNWSLF